MPVQVTHGGVRPVSSLGRAVIVLDLQLALACLNPSSPPAGLAIYYVMRN
ncbi:hypothetical protein QBC99_003492 [Beijerinckia sp. GAS462]|nr:hypothetical protein [Beijerinckia sp. GAS462]SEC85209.1 hypothetical protein SAMN05443249_3723 [Beijerinckia sp. 28-YEA-48]